MMSNDSPHEPCMLQEPDYVPSYTVDNTKYEAENADRFTLNSLTLDMSSSWGLSHYQVNMATLLQLGEWFDHLRELGVYDNTRIILVADHSSNGLGDLEAFQLPKDDGDYVEVARFFPLMLVKDFNASGPLVTDSTFMTNADVPTLAMEGLIDEPTNPFTGKVIDSSAKETEPVYVFDGSDWDTGINNGNVFLPDDWYSVSENIREKDNWIYEGYGTLPEREQN